MSEEAFRWVVAGGVGLAALSFLIFAVVAVVVATIVSKLKKKIDPILEQVTPVVRTVNETAAALKPKVLKISDQAVEVSGVVVGEVHRYGDLSKDVAERAKVQIARLDGAVDNTVEQAHETAQNVKGAVMRPIREVDGVLTGFRTAIQTFARGRRETVHRATQDEEMFI